MSADLQQPKRNLEQAVDSVNRRRRASFPLDAPLLTPPVTAQLPYWVAFAGTPVTLLYEFWNSDNPNGESVASEFDTWLASVRFTE